MRLMGNSAPKVDYYILDIAYVDSGEARRDIHGSQRRCFDIAVDDWFDGLSLLFGIRDRWMLVLMSPPLSAMDSDRFSAGSIKTGRRVLSAKSIMTTLPESFIKGSATGSSGTEETGKTPTIFPFGVNCRVLPLSAFD